MLPLPAQLAIEWLMASGEKTPGRLRGLVEHFCQVHAISDPEEIEHNVTMALEAARPRLTMAA